MSRSDNIYIVGFMGAGKSVVGKLLAKEIGLNFFDTDLLIEESTSKSISQLFNESGEEYFRDVETTVLKKVSSEKNAVIACGGGIILREENRELISLFGTTVFLEATPKTLLNRLNESHESRPLLEGLSGTEKLEMIDNMLDERLPFYRSSNIVVSCDDKTIEDIVNDITIILRGSKAEVVVELGERSYPIYIQQGISSQIGKIVSKLNLGKKIGIVTDDIVSKLYLKSVVDDLSQSGFDLLNVKIPAGEASKSLDVMSILYDKFLGEHFERDSIILALGGGVVGDVAGFAAATLLRGIKFIQVPTTLLAQVDSSVGGKVGINHSKGKNLIGSFYQPNAVIIDTDFLSTLPKKELMCGMAEVIKYGLILDAQFAKYISDNFPEIISLDDPGKIQKLIQQCVKLKSEIVQKDEQESGLRRILNFGHTFGHGVEAILPRGSITHGEAIAFGMISATRLSELVGILPPDQAEETFKIISNIPVNSSIKELNVNDIMETMNSDKKVKEGEIHFVLLDKIGNAVIRSGIDNSLVEKSILFAQESI